MTNWNTINLLFHIILLNYYLVNINKIKTPLNKGDIVGNISIGNRLEYIYIASDVKKANIFELYIKYLKNMFSLW